METDGALDVEPEFKSDLFGDVSWTSTGSLGTRGVGPGVLAGLFAIGTGGSIAADRLAGDSTAATHDSVAMDAPSGNAAASDGFYTPAARLGIVRRWFSLNVKDLAEVMRVQRPTIYAWLASRSTPQASNLDRMRQLHQLATAWRRLGRQPLAKVAVNADEVATLLSMLRASVVDESAVLARFRSIAEAKPPQQTKAERMASQAGLGTDEHDEPDASFDAETLFS